jgi:hypothetical protein
MLCRRRGVTCHTPAKGKTYIWVNQILELDSLTRVHWFSHLLWTSKWVSLCPHFSSHIYEAKEQESTCSPLCPVQSPSTHPRSLLQLPLPLQHALQGAPGHLWHRSDPQPVRMELGDTPAFLPLPQSLRRSPWQTLLLYLFSLVCLPLNLACSLALPPGVPCCILLLVSPEQTTWQLKPIEIHFLPIL